MSLTNKEDPIDYFLNACDKAQIVYKIADQLGERFGSQSNLLRADLQQVLQLGRQALINYHLMPDDFLLFLLLLRQMLFALLLQHQIHCLILLYS